MKNRKGSQTGRKIAAKPARKNGLLPIKSDVIFRLFFADERNREYLVDFLKSALDLNASDYNDIEILDPYLLREHPDDKLGIVDVKLRTAEGKIIHIEVQLRVSSELVNRLIFYGSRLITEQIGDGGDYNEIKRVISIVILDEIMFSKNKSYHLRFRMYDQGNQVELTDLLEIHTLELPKLPSQSDGTDLFGWVQFIKAETEEELKMAEKENILIGRAADSLRRLSENDYARRLYERREKERRDNAMYLRDAQKRGKEEGLQEGREEGLQEGREEGLKEGQEKGREEGLREGHEKGREEGLKEGLKQGQKKNSADIASKLLMLDIPLEQIIEATGLNAEEISSLRS